MNRMQKLRIETRLSQPDMAARIGMPAPTYQRYEHDGIPNKETIVKIAKGFGCSTDYLLEVIDVEPQKQEEPKLSVDEQMLLKKYQTLDIDSKMEALKQLDLLSIAQEEKKKTSAS